MASQQQRDAGGFGAIEPYAEPYWYSGAAASPFYTGSHRAFRARVRAFVDAEIKPNVLRWEKEQELPLELLAKAARAGVYAPQWPTELGGTPPGGEDGSFDAFHDFVWVDELARSASQSVILMFTIYTMALPPVLSLGTEEQVQKVVPAVLAGKACISLAISEPGAGSDVARLTTTANRTASGGWVVNGVKKWITAGCYSKFFVVACRTGGDGAGGLSLLLLERGMEGLETRKLPLQGGRAAGTAMLTLDNVEAPAEALLGEEGAGFRSIMSNFNHERWSIAVQALRFSRVCIEESVRYGRKRKTFGQPLMQHQVIRHKIAEMAMRVESLHALAEQTTYQMQHGATADLARQCALLKVHGSKTFEFCAREASQIFGGASFVEGEGQGATVERLYREVRGTAIPGGSEEIMLDLAMRQAKL
jgi:alkylation response protein AidB-like acyl-CoA dehydrogenase